MSLACLQLTDTGAMRALAHAVEFPDYSYPDSPKGPCTTADDQAVLDRLFRIFQACLTTASSNPTDPS